LVAIRRAAGRRVLAAAATLLDSVMAGQEPTIVDQVESAPEPNLNLALDLAS